MAVGAVGAIIARGQWHTARSKLAFDLFERRLVVADDLLSVIGGVLTAGEATIDDVLKFGAPECRASYLFGSEVTEIVARTGSELPKIGRFRRSRMTEFYEIDPYPVEWGDAGFLKVGDFPREFRELTTPYMQMSAKLPREDHFSPAIRYFITSQLCRSRLFKVANASKRREAHQTESARLIFSLIESAAIFKEQKNIFTMLLLVL